MNVCLTKEGLMIWPSARLRLFLADKYLAPRAQAGLVGEGVKHGIENVFVIQFKAGHSCDIAVRIAVLDCQVLYFGLNQAGRQTNIWDVTGDGGGSRLD